MKIKEIISWPFETWANTVLSAFIGAIIFAGIVITFDSMASREKETYPHFRMPVSAEIPKNPGYLPNAPRTYRNGVHEGIDLEAEAGTPVRAGRSGKILEIGSDEGLDGIYIIIGHQFGPWYHSETWKTKYCHLSEVKVQKGQKVERGQVIALSGCTGYCLEPHLHFAIYRPDGTFLGKDYDELELQLLLSKYIQP